MYLRYFKHFNKIVLASVMQRCAQTRSEDWPPEVIFYSTIKFGFSIIFLSQYKPFFSFFTAIFISLFYIFRFFNQISCGLDIVPMVVKCSYCSFIKNSQLTKYAHIKSKAIEIKYVLECIHAYSKIGSFRSLKFKFLRGLIG